MTHYDSVDAAAALSQLALDIACQPHPADMICRVTQLAAKLIDCEAADIIRITDAGQLRVTASSDPGLSELTAKAWRRWPHHIIADDGGARQTAMMLPRSSYLQQLRGDTGIGQELIVPLPAGQSNHGYLRFLFTETQAAAASRALIAAFSAHAAIALDRAALLTQVTNLQLAVDSNRDIAAAVGVLMTRQQLTYSDGLTQLKVASQNANRKLRDVAAEVLRTGSYRSLSRSSPATFSSRPNDFDATERPVTFQQG